MISCMERIRVYFDADEELKLALKQEALRAGLAPDLAIDLAGVAPALLVRPHLAVDELPK